MTAACLAIGRTSLPYAYSTVAVVVGWRRSGSCACASIWGDLGERVTLRYRRSECDPHDRSESYAASAGDEYRAASETTLPWEEP